MHDDFEPIADIVERLVGKLAPAGEEGSAGAARHGGTGSTAVVLEFRRRRTGAAQPCGPTWPPRRFQFEDAPATGGLGNARLREGR